jgi:hypothetical protein
VEKSAGLFYGHFDGVGGNFKKNQKNSLQNKKLVLLTTPVMHS